MTNWQTLSPEEFKQLQEYTSYSTKTLLDVLKEFNENGSLAKYKNTEETIGFEAFKIFLAKYLETDVPHDTCRHLFTSFIKRPRDDQLATKHNNNNINNDSTKNTNQSTFVSPSSHRDVESLPGVSSQRSLSYPDTKIGIVLQETKLSIQEKMHQLSEKLQNVLSTSDGGNTITKSGSYQNLNQQQSSSSTAPNVISKKLAGISNSNNFATTSNPTDKKCNSSNEIDNIYSVKVPLKDIVCYLSLLKDDRPENKLEFVFHLYDTDGSGYLDNSEMESIVEQMMRVAEYMNWDTIELEPILRQMLKEIDYDSDGTVTLEEWKKAGLTTIPLLVLLGLDMSAVTASVEVFSVLK